MWQRFQLGDWLPLATFTVDANGVFTAPDEPGATAKIFDADGVLIQTVALPSRPERISDVTGRGLGGCENKVRLGSLYAAGKYMISYAYTTGAGANVRGYVETFDIVGGGSTAGAVIATHFHDLPNANNVVFQLDDGTLRRRLNPR